MKTKALQVRSSILEAIKGGRGAVEKVPLILYNTTIIVNRFQEWKGIYVRHPKPLAGRLVCGRPAVPYFPLMEALASAT